MARRSGALALATALAASAIAIAVVAGCATGSPPASDQTSAGRGVPVDVMAGVGQAPTQAVTLAHRAILDTHLSELRFGDRPEHRDAVERFYANRGFTVAWLREGHPTKSAREVIGLLERADAVGLTTEDYDAGRWAERVAALRDDDATDADRARFDLALTVSVMHYAADLHRGQIDPRLLGLQVDAGGSDAETSFDLPRAVTELAATADGEAFLAALAPLDPGYRRLLDVLGRYRELARAEDATPPASFVANDVIRPGDAYADLPRLADLLARLGDLRTTDQGTLGGTVSAAEGGLRYEGERYEGEIVAAVRRFQRRHGLDPDGKIGEKTLKQLSMPFARRVRQVELTLERKRWLPTRPLGLVQEAGGRPGPTIVVNVPEFRLRAFDRTGQVAFSTDVVVGKAGRHETPVFAELLRTVVFRPAWYVPASLTSREIVPEMEKDPGHLSREGYEVLGAEGRDLTSLEVLSDLRRGALRLRQKPGPGNALGPVKFLFPNRWSVYLHGTPSTKGFARARRDLSHGCMRVADPIGLAEWVLRDRPEWTRDRILDATAGPREELSVKLDTPIPVRVVYETVVATADGEVLFLDDLYGHDARLERALERRHPAPAERPAGGAAG